MLKKSALLVCILFAIGAQSQTWQTMAPFPGISRDDAVAEVVNGKAYFGTGFGTGFVYLNDWWEYDFATATWTQKASLPGTARQYAASCVNQHIIYVLGGMLSTGEITNELWAYNTLADTWTLETHFAAGGRQAPVIESVYDELYCGFGKKDSICYGDWWKYNIYLKEWQQLPVPGLAARFDAEIHEAGGNIWFGLGRDTMQGFYDWWQYNPQSDNWIQSISFPGSASTYTAGAVAGELIVISGGANANGDFSNETWGWSATTGQWMVLTDMPSVYRKGGAAVSYSGDNYYISGIDSTFFRTPEVFKLAIDEVLFSNVSVFPNPVEEWLCVNLSLTFSTDYAVEIYSFSNGQKVYASGMDFFRGCFYVRDLSTGLYMARLKKASTYFHSFTFIKQ